MLSNFKEVVIKKDLNIKKEIKNMQKELFVLQQKLVDNKIPVIILLDGLTAAGKGSMLSFINARMEPRNYKIHTISSTKNHFVKRRPPLFDFWCDIPLKGEIAIFYEGWYNKAIEMVIDKEKETKKYIDEVQVFERQLVDDGYLILKFFLHISKNEQEKRLSKLDESKAHRWQVTKKDWEEHEDYKSILQARSSLLEDTNSDFAPWHIIDNDDREKGLFQLLTLLTTQIKEVLKNGVKHKQKMDNLKDSALLTMPLLSQVDLNKKVEDEEYKAMYKEEREKLLDLHSQIYAKKIPVIIAFEGWDAAGKGGAIRRLSWSLDARGLDVYSIAAPTKEELHKHYLYRFWKKVPKTGHIAIFDRSWYGRVMVERLENLTSEKRWSQAYNEMNEFENSLSDFGAIVLKFFIHIDQETQLERFNDRLENPEKQYKMTDEDWRNREKWDVYEVAIDDMIKKTSTKNAPWIIVEGNDKKYARLKVMRTLRKAMQERLKD